MSQTLWVALGLVLIVEGLGPLFAPRGWRQMVAQLSLQPDNQLRRIGGGWCGDSLRFRSLRSRIT